MRMVCIRFRSRWLVRSVLGLRVSAWSFAGSLLRARQAASLQSLDGLQRQQINAPQSRRGKLVELASERNSCVRLMRSCCRAARSCGSALPHQRDELDKQRRQYWHLQKPGRENKATLEVRGGYLVQACHLHWCGIVASQNWYTVVKSSVAGVERIIS